MGPNFRTTSLISRDVSVHGNHSQMLFYSDLNLSVFYLKTEDKQEHVHTENKLGFIALRTWLQQKVNIWHLDVYIK